ncbi:MAG: hypothetical protein WCJ64_02220 [Rhodospirillaceae bacterium]
MARVSDILSDERSKKAFVDETVGASFRRDEQGLNSGIKTSSELRDLICAPPVPFPPFITDQQ